MGTALRLFDTVENNMKKPINVKSLPVQVWLKLSLELVAVFVFRVSLSYAIAIINRCFPLLHLPPAPIA